MKVDIRDVLKQALLQMKYEEIGSWLASHRTPIFYAHKKGFSVIDQKYIDAHPKLKKVLDDVVKDIQKKHKNAISKMQKKAVKMTDVKDLGYIG